MLVSSACVITRFPLPGDIWVHAGVDDSVFFCCTCALGYVERRILWGDVLVVGRDIGTLGSVAGVCGSAIWGSFGTSSACLGMVHSKSLSSWDSASIFSVSRVMKGEAGTGLSRVSASTRAALVALSKDDVVGIEISCGKNSTVRSICSARAFVT